MQNRNLEDISVAAIPNFLYFEMVILLSHCIILLLSILVPPVFILPLFWSLFILPLFWFFGTFISALVLLVFNLPLNEIARTQFFVRWVDCNTPFPEYVLSCVFRFSIVFFDFPSAFVLYSKMFL